MAALPVFRRLTWQLKIFWWQPCLSPFLYRTPAKDDSNNFVMNYQIHLRIRRPWHHHRIHRPWHRLDVKLFALN